MSRFNTVLKACLNVAALLLFLPAISFAVAFDSNAQVVTADTSPVCVEDQATAFENALRHHQRIGRKIAVQKGLNSDQYARSEWEISDFTRGVETYLAKAPGSSLILYDADKSHFCAFLLRAGEQPIYKRIKKTLGEINAQIDWFRRLTARNFHPDDRSAAKRQATNERRLEQNRRGGGDQTHVNAAKRLTFSQVHKSLSEALFPSEFKSALQKTDALTIAPIGAMTALPIGLLRPFGGNTLAVDEFSVNYLLFAGEVQLGALKWSGTFSKPLIFANPETKPEAAGNFSFGEIPETAAEAKDLAGLIGAKGNQLLLGKSATKEAYLSRAGQADLIYFASHAWADPWAEPRTALKRSFILLDEQLNALDARIRLPDTKIVIMSACQTGLGVVTEGGVIGLARTFLDAGAENVVMSLWNISDKGTREFMHHFNRFMRTHPPAEALRKAQLKMLDHPVYWHPAYWAAFGVYGNHGIADGG
jgi:CHAT domain-containing protein